MTSTSDVGWGPDFLPGFEQLTLRLAPDEEGDVVATLVRPARPAEGPSQTEGPTAARGRDDHREGTLAESFATWFASLRWGRRTAQEPPGASGPTSGSLAEPGGSGEPGGVLDAGVDLLYVHGWQDYFFQTHLAAHWEGLGVRFHALDLRKYGRSLREHQTPGYVTDLATYDEDIEAALAAIGHAGTTADAGSTNGRRLLLMGHSTGGLTLSLWAARNPGRASGLVLNSPWLEFQTRQVGRRVLEPGIGAQAAIAPRSQVLFLDRGFYVRSISSKLDGEWDLDVPWRSDEAPWKPTSGWLAAIFRGHQHVARGLGLELPVLVLLSARSTAPLRWSDDMTRSDTVLDVVGIARRATDLGNLCTLVRIEGALHDVTLSAPPAREVVWREMTRWFRCYVGPAISPPTPR